MIRLTNRKSRKLPTALHISPSHKNARIFIKNADFRRMMGNYLGNPLAQRGFERLRLSIGLESKDIVSINVYAAKFVRPFGSRLGWIRLPYETLVLQLFVGENASVSIPQVETRDKGHTFRSFVECLSHMRHLINSGRNVPFGRGWWDTHRPRPSLARNEDVYIPLETEQ